MNEISIEDPSKGNEEGVVVLDIALLLIINCDLEI